MKTKREDEVVCNERIIDSVACEPHSVIMPVILFSIEEIEGENNGGRAGSRGLRVQV